MRTMSRERALFGLRHTARRTGAGSILAALAAALLVSLPVAAAKTPGNTYCFYGTCHRVKSIAETEAMVGIPHTIAASFYDSCKVDSHNPCGLTSSGEPFDPDQPDNAASPIYPDGTKILVWSPETKRAAVLRVNNAGPYWGERKLDVSRATAEQLGFHDRGVADLTVKVIDAPNDVEATYSEGRRYEPVQGYLGQFDSAEAAEMALNALMGLEAIASSVIAPMTGGAVVAARAEAGHKTQHVKLATAAPVPRATQTEPRAVDRKAPPGILDLPAELTRLLDSVGEVFEPAEARRSLAAHGKVRAKSPAPVVAGQRAATPRVAARSAQDKEVRVASVTKRQPQQRAKTTVARTEAAKPAKVAMRPASAATHKTSTIAGPPNDNPAFSSRHDAPAGTARKGKVAAKGTGQRKA